jgi:predicted secreted Zn-dependent protease
MPTGGNVRVQYQQGDPAKMRAQMQQAIGQMSAQKQAMAKYFQDMNMGWDSQMDQLMEKQVSQGVDDQTREILRGPE